MCPKRHMISLYQDGELPSPWKEKMETHLGNCPECRDILAGYRSLGESLQELPNETIQAAQDRVWKKLIAPELIIPGKPEGGRPVKTAAEKILRHKAGRSIWKRSVNMPLPVAAAAGLIIVVIFFALIGVRGAGQSSPHDAMAASPGQLQMVGYDHGMFPVQDMNSVLQFISGQGDGDFMVIRLPESRNFVHSGEPALINAADYSRTRRNTLR